MRLGQPRIIRCAIGRIRHAIAVRISRQPLRGEPHERSFEGAVAEREPDHTKDDRDDPRAPHSPAPELLFAFGEYGSASALFHVRVAERSFPSPSWMPMLRKYL